jgi:integrase/recombinase XerC
MSQAVAMVPVVVHSAAVTPFTSPASAEALLAAWFAAKDPATVRAYRADLAAFLDFLAPHTFADFLAADVGPAHAVALQYRSHLVAAGRSPATVNRRLSALRSVLAFARTVGLVTWRLEVPGVETVTLRDTRGPGADGVARMLAAAAGETVKARRDTAILRLLFDLGLRREEVATLDLAHLELEPGGLWVLGKKRTERERLTLPAPTRAALSAWVAVRGDAAGPLFTNVDRAGKGERLTGRSVARIVNALGVAANLSRRVAPHAVRHAAITHALDVTAGDVRRVAKFSRHRDLRTLAVYDDARRDLAGEVAALVAGAA